MYIEQSLKPVSPVFLRSDSTQVNQNKETFHDIFQRTLDYKSSSRPPKIELTGILIPLGKDACQTDCNFKLETDQNEYILRMSDALYAVATKLEWEEVSVKGYLDLDEGLFEVEKISLSKTNETDRLTLN